jgi:hypothetical protein
MEFRRIATARDLARAEARSTGVRQTSPKEPGGWEWRCLAAEVIPKMDMDSDPNYWGPVGGSPGSSLR